MNQPFKLLKKKKSDSDFIFFYQNNILIFIFFEVKYDQDMVLLIDFVRVTRRPTNTTDSDWRDKICPRAQQRETDYTASHTERERGEHTFETE